MSPEALILLPIGALLAGLILELGLARLLSPQGKGWLAFSSAAAAFGGIIAQWPAHLNGQVFDFTLLPWDGPAALAYHVDGLSRLFALMGTGIGTAVLLYSIAYIAADHAMTGPKATRFYALVLIFIAGLVQLVYSADLLLFYLCWEVIGLCSFLLVGFWFHLPEAAAGARKVLVMTHLAGYGLLAAILLLYVQTGSTLWTNPQVMAAFGTGFFMLMLLAAVAKSVQFPLHTWIPFAMAAPTPVSALLHAACYVKAGVYLIARLHSFGPWPPAWQTTVIWIGTLTLLIGGLYALIQTDLKRLLAFSTVSQIGYMLLGLGLGTPLGIAAGLLHCLNHGLFKAMLFLCAGAVQHASGTREMDQLGGLARRMPKTAVLWLMASASVAGVPLFSGFVSKWLLFNAALEADQMVPALIAWIGSIVTIFYFLKATTRVFLGDDGPASAHSHEASPLMLAGMGGLAVVNLVIGIAPQVAMSYVINPLLPVLGMQPAIGVSWSGLTTGSGSWFASGGLMLALVATGVGAMVYWLAQPRRRLVVVAGAGGGVFSGGEPLSGPAHLPSQDFSLIIQRHLAGFYHWLDVDRYYLALWRGLLQVSERLNRLNRRLETRLIPVMLAGVVLVALLAIISSPAGIQSAVGHEAGHHLAWPLLAGTSLAFAALLLVSLSTLALRSNLLWFTGAGLLSLAGLSVTEPWLRLGLLEGGALLAVMLVWRSIEGRSWLTGYAYLLVVLLSAGLMVIGNLILPTQPTLALALLLTGFTLKLALLPLFLWLPRLAETLPVTVAGLVIAVIDMVAFGEMFTLRQAEPWLFTSTWLWLAIALTTALTGAVLMLAERNLKRLLALSTIEDMGCLTLALTLGGELGLTGAMLGAMVHALAKALLFISLAMPEGEGPLTLDLRGLTSRYPLSGVAFLVGMLAMLGVPPTVGFAARWRLYGAAAEANPWFLAALLLATGLAILAYARVIARCWWGTADSARQTPRREPALVAVGIITLSAVIILAGLWPHLWGG